MMPSLLKEAKTLFGTDDLYEVLNVPRSASKADIKKAYHRLSLIVHPDRVDKDKQEATKKFQVLGKIHSILSDEEKRSVYDETGSVNDDDYCEKDKNWEEYWRLIFPRVNLNDIEDFAKKYKGTTEELEDIKTAYIKYEGDMTKIIDSVMCSTIADEPRFQSIIIDLISSNQLPKFDAFVSEPMEKRKARKRKAEKEEEQAKKVMKKLEIDDKNDNLQALILHNQKSRQEMAEDFFKQMENKYCKSRASAASKESKRTKSKTSLSSDKISKKKLK